ncbi:MAG TPA: 3-isopropylmalate dehydratase small subunit [Limnochordales bacterium]
MVLEGRVHKFGDHIDTDVIIPGPYLTQSDPAFLAQHCMEGIDPDFPRRARPGDVVVAGRDFGTGSSREHAVLALKGLGIAAVVAESFARIFYRNAINLGLPVVTAPEAARAARDGDRVRIDLDRGTVEVNGQVFPAAPFPPLLQQLLLGGGLVPFVQARLRQASRSAG